MVMYWVGKQVAKAAAMHFGTKYAMKKAKEAPGAIAKNAKRKLAKELGLDVPEEKKVSRKKRFKNMLEGLERRGNGEAPIEDEPEVVVPEPTISDIGGALAKKAAEEFGEQAERRVVDPVERKFMPWLKKLEQRGKGPQKPDGQS